ncbi:hypothetical protein [Streptomyces sp. 4N124]|uniref:hypothetical protein n=1 Tax=Streptomyces sp. 4N124 TaxID=3457420 RepID=UPI003FD04920
MNSSGLYNRGESPFEIDDSKLLDDAISTVIGNPEIKSTIAELQNPIDLAAKVKEHRRNILHNIADPLNRARTLGDRLNEELITSDEFLTNLVSASAGLRSAQRAIRDALSGSAGRTTQPYEVLLANAREYRATAESVLASGVERHFKAVLRAVTPPSAASASEDFRADLEIELAGLKEVRHQIDEMARRRFAQLVPPARSQLGFRALEGQWEAAVHELSQTIELTVQSFVLTDLNSELAQQYNTRMRVRSAEGLRERLTREKVVRTPAYDQLDVMMRQRQGGSFGISGPRGVGKTTLIEFFTKLDGVRDKDGPEEKQALGAQVSAPVQYDREEFVLHLHATLCRKIIGSDGDRALDAPNSEESRIRIPLVAHIGMTFVGSVFLVAATALLVHAFAVPPVPTDLQVWGGVSASAVAAGLLGYLMAVTFALLIDVVAQPRASSVEFAAWQGPSVRRLYLASRLFLPVAAAGAALFVLAPSWDGTWTFLLGAVTGAAGLSVLSVTAGPLVLRRSLSESSVGLLLSHAACSASLVEAAVDELRRIRYQQSFSSERSMAGRVGGNRRFPLAMEAGVKQGTAWAERRRTYPEIVTDFLNFLVRVVQECHVVIAIDELDKIKDGDSAQDFLNDIKGIFEAPGCFFLVSVSEDAAGNFERRGAPFRDVFDSAFDDMVTMDRLGLADARKILYGLLLGWTEPFIGLCYVLSGGLPRDLHRSARGVIGDVFREHGNGKPEIELENAMLDLLRRECGGRLRAVRKSVTSDSLDAAGLGLLDVLDGIEPDERTTAAHFSRWHDELHRWTSARSATPDTAQQPRAVRLGRELEAFMYFTSTVCDFFATDRISTRMREARNAVPGRKCLDRLASARHAISLDPGASLCQTKSFREAWGLD